jgi:hypothetical protein
MKYSSISKLVIGFFAILSFSEIFANTFVAGGSVPEQRNISVTPNYSDMDLEPMEMTEVATIQIDNNLPNYDLVLEFSDRYGTRDLIDEVHLIGMVGTLGEGLEVPANARLTQVGTDGRFVWSPGTQKSATLAYQLKVLVTYKRALTYKEAVTNPPLLTVSMPSAF